MIACRLLACTAAALCLMAPGCGDDGSLTSGFSAGSNAASEGSSGSGTGGSSGGPATTNNSSDPTTGGDGTSTTNDSNGPTTNNTTTPQTTGDLTTTTSPDTTTTDTTNTTNNSTDPAGCGNGAIDPNEQCDGGNLNGFTCESLGNAGGTLGCDPVTCTFDTSMCMGNGSGGTSG